MKALVYHGSGNKSWEELPDPKLDAPTDANVKVDLPTICGTDLHILKGDLPAVTEGRRTKARGGWKVRVRRLMTHPTM